MLACSSFYPHLLVDGQGAHLHHTCWDHEQLGCWSLPSLNGLQGLNSGHQGKLAFTCPSHLAGNNLLCFYFQSPLGVGFFWVKTSQVGCWWALGWGSARNSTPRWEADVKKVEQFEDPDALKRLHVLHPQEWMKIPISPLLDQHVWCLSLWL